MKIYVIVSKETGKRKISYGSRVTRIYLVKNAAIRKCPKGCIVLEYDLSTLKGTQVNEVE